ncbi:signal recognition particle-docking protein FtsY [Kluyvera ascorbata]|uniref:signal recognition particle-docking protein FtsY n=1 Tax=Kluyvera ascorbata TaxID=51288 RepID=UPI0004E460E5|nr:signal recognition particle-docking protein FtsY [Kluyvera ascorbata]EJG2386334.1 signal recognition particle-docking protein FtsY [Kluyvera ascorbata]KFD01616.1 signal recognition particle receptor protein [Kluyvera ascorbata ATCC 33433]MDU1194854.1 signal recognition particle-docking protein FtsY [Kluyvera ascorbata]STW97018.1 Cell division protein FtsY [Kluyvera ascorbata]BCA37752.1 signal recognition particle receptor FtsY [Kluyvera ascorbata]
MAKEKKRGFFSWLGFGQKEQDQVVESEEKIEEQPVAETPTAEPETVAEETPRVEEARAPVEDVAEPHTIAESEAFAEEVVEVTEQVAEREIAQTEAVEEIQPEVVEVVEPVAEVQPEVVEAVEPVAEVQPETVEVVEPVAEVQPEMVEEIEPEAVDELTDEELEAQALAAESENEAVEEEAAVEESTDDVQQEQEKPTKEGFFARLKRSLLKTKENLGSGFISLFRGKKIDDDLFEELEEQLLIADVGVETTRKIINNLTETASRKQLRDAEALYGLLKDEMGEILAKVDEPLNIEDKTPFVILMVGVNGVGKTTTIGKLARQFEQQGKTVMLAAGDTFRAAAVEQLQVWGQRNNIPVIAQHTGADSASVIFDAIQAAKARNVDVLIADTAGRLQNKSHLMEELKKIVRVMKKLDVDAPHEVMLTIDASTGQNAISQAKLFHEAVGLTGITLTKLDGTAKGGVIFSVADQFGIPIRYIGVGERIEDLRPFKAGDFIEALFARED